MKTRYGLLLLFLALVVVACSPQTLYEAHDSGVQYFSSEAEFLSVITSSSQGSGSTRMMVDGAVAESAAAPSSAQRDAFSGTNVQEVGVDEADIFKTDGEFVYTSSGSSLFITSTGENAEVLFSTDMNMSVQGLFIQDDYLVVIGSSNQFFGVEPMIRSLWPSPRSSEMQLVVFDISSPQSPSVVKEFSYEGWYVNARLKDGVVYVVANSQATDSLPLLRVDGVQSRLPATSIAYFPRPYNNPQLTAVHTLDLSSLSIHSDAVLTEGASEVYMNEHLFISSTRFVNEWELRQETTMDLGQRFLTREDRELLSRIDAVDNDILSSSEKRFKKQEVTQSAISHLSRSEQEAFIDEVDAAVKKVLEEKEFREFTEIHKFSVDTQGVRFVASQEIVGFVYGQFAFSEKEGVLRVATTTNRIWSSGSTVRESENHIYTLDESLNVLDSVHGLAPTERVFSARYVEDTLYLVTFEEIDPFFVIDLSNPRSIEVLGELKITGFSRYLHPISETTVLGFGREATETGRQQGLKISLFDVSDVNNPVEKASWVSDHRFASSAAEWDHRAVLYIGEHDLLVVPVQSYDRDNRYAGAFVFTVTEEEVSLRGLVDHQENAVERSAYIGEHLYTKSFSLLRVNALESLRGVVDVPLVTPARTDVPVY